MLLYSWKKAGEKGRLILSSDTKYNQINFSKNHVSGNARKIGVTFIWWFTRDTNDRVYQFPEYRVVKLRVANSGQKWSKSNGFRLIYWVSLLHDCVVLMRVYPKRGSLAAVDLVNAEYTRLQMEVFNESKANMLHQVDITNGLAELSQNECLPGDK